MESEKATQGLLSCLQGQEGVLLQEHKLSGVSDSISLRRNIRLFRSLAPGTIAAIQLQVTAGLLSVEIALTIADCSWYVFQAANTF